MNLYGTLVLDIVNKEKMMKFLRKKDVQANVYSDTGMVQKTDVFSVVVIIASIVISLFLIALAIATLMLS